MMRREFNTEKINRNMSKTWMYRTHIRGHLVETYNGKDWYYVDTKELYNHNDKSCVKCGLFAKHNEPDPCLGMLKDVTFACCGHGIKGEDYVVYLDERMSLEQYQKIKK